MHGFWTFLFERINKVLKSYNSSNHSGGELETSFFREFHRTIQQSRVVSSFLNYVPKGSNCFLDGRILREWERSHSEECISDVSSDR